MNNPYYIQAGQGDGGGQNSGGKGQAIMGAIDSGVGAYAESSASTNDFTIDPNAGFKGSFKGLGQGGVIGAIAGGIGAQIGTFSQVNRNLKNLNTNVNAVNYDDQGNAYYNGQAVADAQINIGKLNEGQRSLNKGIDPATRAFGWAYGTKKKIKKRRGELQANIAASQARFNNANISAKQQELARASYMDQLNPYGIPRNYY